MIFLQIREPRGVVTIHLVPWWVEVELPGRNGRMDVTGVRVCSFSLKDDSKDDML